MELKGEKWENYSTEDLEKILNIYSNYKYKRLTKLKYPIPYT